MEPFTYVRVLDEQHAIGAGKTAESQFLAGGTNLVDMMRLEVMRPTTLVDITRVPLATIDETPTGVRLGALASNTAVAYHPLIAKRYPVLAQAILSGASPQLRNMASVGGNLMQRTRCPYFRDAGVKECNKRRPGSGCAAIGGSTRSHAVLGGSDQCIAAHPSDLCVAMLVLDATIHVKSGVGERAIAMADLHVAPEHPHIEHTLLPGELITSVELPKGELYAKSVYVKVRDRASFAFALASAGVALEVTGGKVTAARIALGGVATRPWRAKAAEDALVGQVASTDSFKRAAAVALQGAVGRGDNDFKIELAQRTIVRALQLAGGVA